MESYPSSGVPENCTRTSVVEEAHPSCLGAYLRDGEVESRSSCFIFLYSFLFEYHMPLSSPILFVPRYRNIELKYLQRNCGPLSLKGNSRTSLGRTRLSKKIVANVLCRTPFYRNRSGQVRIVMCFHNDESIFIRRFRHMTHNVQRNELQGATGGKELKLA